MVTLRHVSQMEEEKQNYSKKRKQGEDQDGQMKRIKVTADGVSSHDYEMERFVQKYLWRPVSQIDNLTNKAIYDLIVKELYSLTKRSYEKMRIFTLSTVSEKTIRSAAYHARKGEYEVLGFRYAELCQHLLGTLDAEQIVHILFDKDNLKGAKCKYMFFLGVVKPFLEVKSREQIQNFDIQRKVHMDTYFLYSGKYFDFYHMSSLELTNYYSSYLVDHENEEQSPKYKFIKYVVEILNSKPISHPILIDPQEWKERWAIEDNHWAQSIPTNSAELLEELGDGNDVGKQAELEVDRFSDSSDHSIQYTITSRTQYVGGQGDSDDDYSQDDIDEQIAVDQDTTASRMQHISGQGDSDDDYSQDDIDKQLAVDQDTTASRMQHISGQGDSDDDYSQDDIDKQIAVDQDTTASRTQHVSGGEHTRSDPQEPLGYIRKIGKSEHVSLQNGNQNLETNETLKKLQNLATEERQWENHRAEIENSARALRYTEIQTRKCRKRRLNYIRAREARFEVEKRERENQFQRTEKAMQVRKAQLQVQENLLEETLHIIEVKSLELEVKAKGNEEIRCNIQRREDYLRINFESMERRDGSPSSLKSAQDVLKQHSDRDDVAAKEDWLAREEVRSKFAVIDTKLGDFDREGQAVEFWKVKERALQEKEAELSDREQYINAKAYMQEVEQEVRKDHITAKLADIEVKQQEIQEKNKVLEAQSQEHQASFRLQSMAQELISQKVERIRAREIEIRIESEQLEKYKTAVQSEMAQKLASIELRNATVCKREQALKNNMEQNWKICASDIQNSTAKRWLNVSVQSDELDLPIHQLCVENESCLIGMEGKLVQLCHHDMKSLLDSDFYCLNMLRHQSHRWHPNQMAISRISKRAEELCLIFTTLLDKEKAIQTGAVPESTLAWERWIADSKHDKNFKSVQIERDLNATELKECKKKIARLQNRLEGKNEEIRHITQSLESYQLQRDVAKDSYIEEIQATEKDAGGTMEQTLPAQGVLTEYTISANRSRVNVEEKERESSKLKHLDRAFKDGVVEQQESEDSADSIEVQPMMVNDTKDRELPQKKLLRVKKEVFRAFPNCTQIKVANLQKLLTVYDISYRTQERKSDLVAKLTLAWFGLPQDPILSIDAKALWATRVDSLRSILLGKRLKPQLVANALLKKYAIVEWI